MKSLRHYLMESVHTYRYKIKIAGETPKNFVDMFCYNLQKFDPVKISDPKTTPVQKNPHGFPDVTNQPVTMIDVEFKYPCTEPMVKQVARLLNYDENLVRMLQSDYEDSIEQEDAEYAGQTSPLLDSPYQDMPGAKEAAKAYGDSYLQSIKKQHEEAGDEVEYPYAAPKTKQAFDPFVPYLSQDKLSPMTKINRPPKPETGASKSRG